LGLLNTIRAQADASVILEAGTEGAAPVGALAIDRPLDVEQRVDAADRLERQRRDHRRLLALRFAPGVFGQIRHGEEGATGMHPARRFKDIAGTSPGPIKLTIPDRHETVYIAWDNANTHADEAVEAVVRGAAGRLVLLYLPTYSPWLNPIEMLWRQFRREVTHCELFDSIDALIEATDAFFARHNQAPERVRSIIGAHPI
jgi:transposase